MAQKILVIDDDEAILEILTKLLEREGYQVDTATDGASGLALFDRNFYDLVITDIIMPVKDGLDTILELRKKDIDLPVIAISGGGQIPKERYLEIAAYLQNTETMAKPFTREEMVGAVKRLIGQEAEPDGLEI